MINFLRIANYFLFGVSVVVVAVVLLVRPELILGGELTLSVAHSMVGIAIGSIGLFFSAYAAIEVGIVSNRYLFKVKSPHVLKRVASLIGEVSRAAQEEVASTSNLSIFPKTSAVLRDVKRLKVQETSLIAKRIEKKLVKLTDEVKAADPSSVLSTVSGFFDFSQDLYELRDELRIQYENERIG